MSNQSLPIPNVIAGDWRRLDQVIRKIKRHLGQQASPTLTGLTLTGLTADTVLYANSSKAVTSFAAMTNGQLVVGSTDATPVLAELTGTANQVVVANAAGSITLSLPQDYDTGATPTLAGLTITNAITEFSTDGTLGGNSDSALPTEKAVKTYVDLAIGSSKDYFLSDNDDPVIANYHILHETDTGEAASTEATAAMGIADDQLMFSHITTAGVPGVTFLRSGVYILHTHLAQTTGTRTTKFYWTLSKYTTVPVETVLMTSEESSAIPGSMASFITHATLAADEAINDTDRLVLKLYANVTGGGANTVITIYMEGTNDCHLTNLLPSSIWQNQGDVLDDLNILGVSTADGEFLVATGADALAWESGATARTSIGLGTGDSPTFTGLDLTGTLTVDTINEHTGAAGVTIEGVTCKDSDIWLGDNDTIGFGNVTGAADYYLRYDGNRLVFNRGIGTAEVWIGTSHGETLVAGHLFSSGKLMGIGAAAARHTWRDYYDVLEIGGTGAMLCNWATSSSMGISICQNAYYDTDDGGDDRWEYTVADEASLYSQRHGEHIFYVNAGAGAAEGGPITWVTALTIQDDAKVLCAATFESTGVATLADGSTLKTNAAPGTDAEIANKKYVDDEVAGGGGGVSTWIDLTDTDPANYTDQAGKSVVVNAGEDGLEFGVVPSGAFTSYSKASLTSAAFSVNDVTWTKIPLDNDSTGVNYDNAGEFDPVTNYRFTATSTGYYAVALTAVFLSMLDGDFMQAAIYINGVANSPNQNFVVGGNTNCAMAAAADIYLAANDYVELYVYINTLNNNARNIYGAGAFTMLTIHRFA